MTTLLVVSARARRPADVLPVLALLGHPIRLAAPDAAAAALAGSADPPELVLLDARDDLAAARATCRRLTAAGGVPPVLVVMRSVGVAALSPDWGVADLLLADAGPAEVEARLRLALGRARPRRDDGTLRVGELVIDEPTYAARLRGRTLDLTFKEFELLKCLAAHPGRVFGRDRLLAEVWGEHYYGGIRTVDVHVRRLRAKLGPEHEQLIGTVRNVGYKLVPAASPPAAPAAAPAAAPTRLPRRPTRVEGEGVGAARDRGA